MNPFVKIFLAVLAIVLIIKVFLPMLVGLIKVAIIAGIAYGVFLLIQKFNSSE